MTPLTPAARRLGRGLAVLMVAQAAGGLAWPGLYRDVAWIRATWLGNDVVTLLVAVPMLTLALARADTSVRARLLALGAAGYGVYNYAFYLLGAALNAAFPLYVTAVLVAGLTLAAMLGSGPVPPGDRRVERPVAWFLMILSGGLGSVWAGTWGAYVFGGRPTPVAPDVFRLVAALDLTLMVPALAGGGWQLVRRHAWGPAVAALAAVQASLYLFVLTVNATVAIGRGLAEWPGEMATWGPLWGLTTVATLVLLRGAGRPAISSAGTEP